MSIQTCIQTLVNNLPGNTAVISPGSRNAPVIFALNQLKEKCYSIIDERSAGFVALGIAKQSQSPVILSCTSGTATLNYYPAIAEAFYARIPLIVITADRPSEHIDAWDGQAIRHKNVFQNHIRASFQTPEIYDDDSGFLNVAHNVSKCLINDIPGPIHINVPIREPFYDFEDTITKSLTKVETKKNHQTISLKNLAKHINVPIQHQKVMIFNGMDDGQHITIENDHAVVLSDITSATKSNVSYWDAMLFSCLSKPNGFKALKVLQPDILFSTGTTTISKGLKRFLSIYKPKHHFHISNFEEVGDMFGTEPQIVSPSDIIQHVSQENEDSPSLAYLNSWTSLTIAFRHKFSQLDWTGYHEFGIINHILDRANTSHIIHYSNSMPVRYASFLTDIHNAKNRVYANRGTSGIDGCTSTALGCALATDQSVLLITGDVAFFYDINALFNKHLPNNFKIIILNNQGGGIFNMISGPENLGNAKHFQNTPHYMNAISLCEHFDITYFESKDSSSFRSRFNAFIAFNGCAIFEVKTVGSDNENAFNAFKKL